MRHPILLLIPFCVLLGGCDKKDEPGFGPSASQITAACDKVCSCFNRASEQEECKTSCNPRHAGLNGGARSFGSASFDSDRYFSSFSGPATELYPGPSVACVTCIANTTCVTLESNTACSSECFGTE